MAKYGNPAVGAKILSGCLTDPKAFVKGGKLDGPKKPMPEPHPDFPRNPKVRDFPAGFADKAEYDRFVTKMNQHLRGAGFPDARPIFQGSSTTGWSPHKKTPFGPDSDYDIALADQKLFDRAKVKLVEERDTTGRTEPLTKEQVNSVGLKRMQRELEQMAGREVNFMVFADAGEAKRRGAPNNIFPPLPRP